MHSKFPGAAASEYFQSWRGPHQQCGGSVCGALEHKWPPLSQPENCHQVSSIGILEGEAAKGLGHLTELDAEAMTYVARIWAGGPVGVLRFTLCQLDRFEPGFTGQLQNY